MAEDMLVATIRAMMMYKALLHTRLFEKIRRRKRQMESLVNMVENMTSGVDMNSIFTEKDICSGDR